MQKERRIGILILRRFALGLAVAAFVAPAAQAGVDEAGGGAGSIAGAAVLHGESKGDYPVALGDSTVLIHGEYKGGYPAPGDSTVLIRGEYKGEYPAPGDPTVPVVVSTPRTTAPGGLGSPSTFDWGDAVVGAGGAFGLMVLAGGSALGLRGRPHPAGA